MTDLVVQFLADVTAGLALTGATTAPCPGTPAAPLCPTAAGENAIAACTPQTLAMARARVGELRKLTRCSTPKMDPRSVS